VRVVHRIILVKLQERYRIETLEVVARISDLLAGLHMLAGFTVAPAMDDGTRKKWDLVVEVRYRTDADGVAYLGDPVHAAFVAHYLNPRTATRETLLFREAEPVVSGV